MLHKLPVPDVQAASLLAAVKLQPEAAAEVDSVKAAVASVQAAGPGAEAACEELEERCRSRLLFAAAADAPGVQAELAAIHEVQAAWQALLAAAAEREQAGIQLPAEAAAGDGEAAGGSRPPSVLRGLPAGSRSSLLRTASSASSASSKAKPSRGPSRAAPSRDKAAAP